MYTKNNTMFFIQAMEEEDRQFLRKRAREDDASGLAKRQHMIQAEANRTVVKQKWCADDVKDCKKDEKRDALLAFCPQLDISAIKINMGNCQAIHSELE